MIDTILTSFRSHPSHRSVTNYLREKNDIHVHGFGGSSIAFYTALLLGENHTSPEKIIVAILPDEDEAGDLLDDLTTVVGESIVKYFPERDTSPYEHADSHIEVRSQRIEILDAISRGWQGIVVATIGAIHDPTTPKGLIESSRIVVRKEDKLEFGKFVKTLITRGFKRQNTVYSAGQIAVRGGIVDIFPFGGELPYRIEFFGDTIDSIRTFSTENQRSREVINDFTILPSDEFIVDLHNIYSYESRLSTIEHEADIDLHMLRLAMSNGDLQSGIEQYIYTLFGLNSSLITHLSSNDLILIFDPERCRHEIEKRMSNAQTAWENQITDEPNLPPPEYFLPSPYEVMKLLTTIPVINNYSIRPQKENVIAFSIMPSRQYQGSLNDLKSDIRALKDRGIVSTVFCDNKGQVERLQELLEDIEGDYAIRVGHLSGGFTDTTSGNAVFTDHEIFSRYRQRVRYRRYKEGIPIPDHRALTMGDYVVHVDYGIGKFMGLERATIAGSDTDCLIVRYRGDDQLLVPVGQLHRLKKYSSEEGVIPVVSKLGGTSWEKLKERTKKSIQQMAGDLLRLYAERKAYDGFAFTPDGHLLREMLESFIYEETPDQLQTWQEVFKDMETPTAMDRLICGDVGFGKTEIAMRAAFIAVLCGKQVAMLVPTTILAEQHEETFRERFADFPVHIASLSRFRSKAEQKKILKELATGQVDIIIGTHRLLSKDVHIKNLGLIIIDEEQRFGVRHKERMKKFRRNVDVLAMSATPIPRTLNMSLLGARDISYINTPPQDRYSVHTEVVPFNERFVIEAIMREIDRDGQVFFVHNRVRSIGSMASYLQKLMPQVTFGVAHGQLPERELAAVVSDFHHGKFQILVTSMIIENGLDMPAVNTILINRADTFGLAQLYQLRGRVGRSNRRAFAYLLVPPKTPLSKIARQRLRTIEEFTSLGSGFGIALRDLEIRGAGNILGTEQSGFISAIGFDLYMDLLRETVAELKGEKVERPPDIDIHIKEEAYFPETFIPDPQERVVFYRRLSESVSEDEVRIIEEEVVDRFGTLPVQVRNLFNISYMKHYGQRLGVSEVLINDIVTLIIPEGIEITREKIENMVKRSPIKLEFSFHKGMVVTFHAPTNVRSVTEEVKKVLQALVT